MEGEVICKVTSKYVEGDANEKAKQSAKKIAKTVEREANKANKKITFGDKIKSQLQEAKKGIEVLGMGGDKLSKIGDFFAGGKIALIIAMLGLIGKTAYSLWDGFTETTAQKIEKARTQVELLKKDIEELNKIQTKEREGLTDLTKIEELRKLNEFQVIPNSSRYYATNIIDDLTKKYQGLGLAIDMATGKITGLETAESKLLQFQSQKMGGKLGQQKRLFEDLANQTLTAQFNKMAIPYMPQLLQMLFGGLQFVGGEKIADTIRGYGTEDKLKIFKNMIPYLKTESQIESVKNLINMFEELQKAEKQYNDIVINGVLGQEKQFQKSKQKSEQDLKNLEALKKRESALKEQLQYQKLLLQGRYREAEQLKLINELKSQGITYTKEDLQRINQATQKLASFNVDKSIQEQKQKLADKILPKDEVTKRIQELQRANKTTLTQSQKARVKRLVQIELQFEKSQKNGLQAFTQNTNELTRRGGFKGGYYSNAETILKQIAENTKDQVRLQRIANRLNNTI